MKKKIICLVLLIPLIGFCQSNSEEHKYMAEVVYYIILNDDGSEKSKKAIGKSPIIVYDDIYKIYTISYTNRDYKKIYDKYEVDGLDESSGLLRLKKKNESFSDFYFADDKLGSEGTLNIYYYGLHDNIKSTGYQYFTNAKPH